MTNSADVQASRSGMIEKSLQSYREHGEKKTMSIQFRGQDLSIEVIRIHPKYLLLNHDNSRLRAQLEDHPEARVVIEDPSSNSAQQILENLLRKTERYGKLKEELKTLKQINPGLITRDGVLINGNTRVAALRELNEEGVDVGVLPKDAVAKDLLDLEMTLQMRKLTHQDYTFTNELLLMEKYQNAGNTDAELAQKMGWSRGWKKKIEQAFQLLYLIKEIRSITSPRLAYEVFDSRSQHLKDLNEDFQSLAKQDLEAANRMKWSRVAAMFLGVNKDQTRVIDQDFLDEEVTQGAVQNDGLMELLSRHRKVVIPDELDDVVGPASNVEERVDSRALVQTILQSLVTEDGYVTSDFPEGYIEFRKAMRNASDHIISALKKEKLLLQPVEVMREIRKEFERVVSDFNGAATQNDFNLRDFEYELERVNGLILELQKEIESKKDST